MTTRITTQNITDATITTTDIASSVPLATNWQAVTVADGSTQLTAEAGKGYFLDTNAGVIEVFLPASPSRGDTIVLADYAGHFALNNVLVNTGTQLIDSVTTAGAGQGYALSTNNLVVELVYVDSSKGWLVKENEAKNSLTAAEDTNAAFIAATGGTVSTVDTNFKVHAFTGDGNFVVSATGNPAGSDTVDYLVIAGGGGSTHDRAGGGGAGGYREAKTGLAGTYTASPLANPTGITVSAQTYPITVGGGGAADNQSPHTTANAGSNSVFSTITSAGGGAGNRSGPVNGGNGGSGGGGGHASQNGTGGSGNTPPVSPPQGNNGGDAGNQVSGGGGGATAVGQNGPGPKAGGAGATSEITGSPVARAGGGGGIASGTGGSGGGGAGGADCSGSGGTDGTANTGGGAGGGGSNTDGGSGGSGVVIIRYKFQS